MGFEIDNGILTDYIEEDGVTDIVIPYGVTSIGGYAFSGCKNITNVIIPDSVTFICEFAFNLNGQFIPPPLRVRVSGGHLCRRQKHRPNRQVRPGAFRLKLFL